jgi:hypothetical protein
MACRRFEQGKTAQNYFFCQMATRLLYAKGGQVKPVLAAIPVFLELVYIEASCFI